MTRASTLTTRYTNVAIALHWTIAFLIIGNLVLGLQLESFKGTDRFAMYQLHKSLGISVLLLTVVRIAWRLSHKPPPYEATLKPWERRAATATHSLFYILLIAMPLTGWIMVSASKWNIPTMVFGVVRWPHIAPIHAADTATRAQIDAVSNQTHELIGYTMIALVALHVLGAIKHVVVDGDGTFARMIPGRTKFEDRSPAE